VRRAGLLAKICNRRGGCWGTRSKPIRATRRSLPSPDSLDIFIPRGGRFVTSGKEEIAALTYRRRPSIGGRGSPALTAETRLEEDRLDRLRAPRRYPKQNHKRRKKILQASIRERNRSRTAYESLPEREKGGRQAEQRGQAKGARLVARGEG